MGRTHRVLIRGATDRATGRLDRGLPLTRRPDSFRVVDIVKKTLPTTQKARSLTGWHRHLRKPGKRVANKGTRKLLALRPVDLDQGEDPK